MIVVSTPQCNEVLTRIHWRLLRLDNTSESQRPFRQTNSSTRQNLTPFRCRIINLSEILEFERGSSKVHPKVYPKNLSISFPIANTSIHIHHQPNTRASSQPYRFSGNYDFFLSKSLLVSNIAGVNRRSYGAESDCTIHGSRDS